MRYLIISDIHANLEALEAVLAAAPRESYDRLVVLGDIVGYGADPNAVVERVREIQPDVIIRGNHDKVACGIEEPEGFNQAARQAAMWTLEQLTPDNRRYLAGLAVGPLIVDDCLEVCHGSPVDEDSYVFEHLDALGALQAARRSPCFFGHTHVQIGFWLSATGLDVLLPDVDGETHFKLDPAKRYIINPGSVGQPRDGDPRAAFARFDADAQMVALFRIAYAVEAAQAKITAAGLPAGLAKRLELGK